MKNQQVRHILKIFTGNAHPALAREICAGLGVPLGKAQVDGEYEAETGLAIVRAFKKLNPLVFVPDALDYYGIGDFIGKVFSVGQGI